MDAAHTTDKGTHFGTKKISDVTLSQLAIAEHHSIRLKIGIDDSAINPGGINIFGKGFGNHNQDILMKLHLKPPGGPAKPVEAEQAAKLKKKCA